MRSSKKPKETAAQRTLREAQELVKAAKKAEQEAWRAKWQAQQNDPEYKAKQERLAETREERSRKMAIGKENAQLARLTKLMKLAEAFGVEFIAYHEAGHAVIHEVLGNGVREATIVPREKEKDSSSNSQEAHFSLGHVVAQQTNFPIPDYHHNLYEVTTLLAGGVAAANVYEVDDDDAGTGSDDEKVQKIIEGMDLNQIQEWKFRHEAWELCFKLVDDPKIWAAIEEVKEALLTYKMIPGDVVRAIVKKQDRPDLFPVSITKQLSFHYRKEFFTSYWGTAPYSLGIGDNHWGFTLSSPKYVRDFEKANAQVPKSKVPQSGFGQLPMQLSLPYTTPAIIQNKGKGASATGA